MPLKVSTHDGNEKVGERAADTYLQKRETTLQVELVPIFNDDARTW